MAPNRMSRSLSVLERLPPALRTRLRSLALGRVVPLVGTAGLVVEHLDDFLAFTRVLLKS